MGKTVYYKASTISAGNQAPSVEVMEDLVPKALIQALKKQKYHLVGKHSAVKRCKWFYEALTSGRSCYKQKFYGINSHQCIQMSPALFYCTQQCLFCWRAQNGDLQINWDELRLPEWDSPEEITEGIVKAQSKILSGYKGNPKTDPQKFREAHRPRHVAISLTGEPTLYASLGELIQTLHNRGLTTFLVSNGNLPQKLSALNEEPTQLYVSVCSPNQETFKRVCRPQVPNAWERLNETLELLPSFRCPTVIRSTLVKDLNMNDVEGYAQLVSKAEPTYVEAKAYMHVGFSGLRLGFDSMPSHKDVYKFARKLSEKTGYKILDESPDSRVVLLSKRDKPIRFSSP
ncbi:MAG: 4-demethylwyosine synthase TYW1 [Candidatus Bathyarchaeota archaeon]|nr:4-demethylwyosine synthase TYW1 [Candidatus Bathyarchaeota archaeon]